jgi:Mitochondrial carrier protein
VWALVPWPEASIIVLPILFQVNEFGVLAALRQLLYKEGFFSLWKGNFITLVHRVPYSAMNFAAYEYTKDKLRHSVSNDVARRLISGAAAGLVACSAVRELYSLMLAWP